MKHFTKFLAALALIATVCIGFASCGDDNGDTPKPSGTPRLTNNFSFTATADLVETADITVDYTDFAGAKHTKVIAAGKNEISFSTTTYPVSSTFVVTVTPKTTELTKDKYDLGFSVELGATKQNSVGEEVPVCSFGRYGLQYKGVSKTGVAKKLDVIKKQLELRNADFTHQYFYSNGEISYK